MLTVILISYQILFFLSLMSGSAVDALILEAPYTRMGEVVISQPLVKVRSADTSGCFPEFIKTEKESHIMQIMRHEKFSFNCCNNNNNHTSLYVTYCTRDPKLG